MNTLTARLFERTIADPASAEQLLAGFGTRSGHLDSEELALILDGRPAPLALGHAIACEDCTGSIEALAHLLDLEPFPSGPFPKLETPKTVLFARLRSGERGELEITGCSGATRIQSANMMRAGRQNTAVSLRDAADGATLEIGLIPEPDPNRLSLVVRWLKEAENLCARVYRAGRLIADTEFDEGSALLSNLRKCDLRIDVTQANVVLATARLEIEPT
ncbi:MAG: hypothetical protein ACJAYU_003535 [Bradymonadia bacterium]|jgi:hypothetical protein